MATSSPPISSPTAVPPTLATPGPPSAPSPSNSTTISSPPPQSPPDPGSSPPTPANPSNNSSSPPPQSAPPPVSTSLLPPLSSPPSPPPPAVSPPPSSPPVVVPPPSPPLRSPPPNFPPPPPPASSPPPTLSPPSPPSADPPPAVPPSPPSSSPPLPLPPPVSPSPPSPLIASPPSPPSTDPPPAVPPSPPSSSPPLPLPPTDSPSPPSPLIASPPPPVTVAPQSPPNSPSPPSTRSPEDSPPPRGPPSPVQAPPPSPSSPQRSSPPPPINRRPTSPPPPALATSPPPSNSSASGTPSTPSPPSPTTPPNTVAPPASPTPTNSSNPNPGVVSGGANPTGSRGIQTGSAVVIGFIVGFLVLSCIGIAVWCARKQKKRASGNVGSYIMPSPFGSSQSSGSSFIKTPSSSAAPLFGTASSGNGFQYTPSESGGLGNSRSWFTYEELLVVTNGFSEHNLLGEGGFGSVYKGCLADGREVAVKQLKVGGAQGEREFRAEVEIISRIHHRHLVSLVGYCISELQRLLVYDYVPNNTLYYHLHEQGSPVMDWATRVKVAAGSARGLAYLHEDCHPRVIHRDIKSSNILLENNFDARVSDFGLAKLALDSFTHVTTRVMGTFGYMAPEYASSGKLTDRSDVFSFGVVLLELITGRKSVDPSQPLGDESLVEWARPLLNHALDNGNFEGLVDPRLEKNYVESEMFRMIEVAAACVRHSAAKRPRMGQVVRALECIPDSDLTNGMKPGESELFDSAQQSAEIRLFQRMAFGSQEYSSDFSQRSWNT